MVVPGPGREIKSKNEIFNQRWLERGRKLHSANFERASVDHVITGEDDLRIAVRDATAIP